MAHSVYTALGPRNRSRDGLVLLLLLFFLPSVNAQTVTINDTLVEGDFTTETVLFDVVNYTGEPLTFQPIEGATNIKGDWIAGKLQRSPCAQCTLYLSYDAPATIQQQGSVLGFERTLPAMEHFSLLRYTVNMPLGDMLVQTNAENPAIVPRPKVIGSDGRHIQIVWEATPEMLPERYFVQFQEENAGISAELQERTVWILLAMTFFVGAVAGAGWYRARFKPADMPFVPASLLTPDEKVLLAAVKGVTPQKQLTHDLQWSKSKVSAVVTNLEHKKIISREKFGRNYKIKVVKEII